MRILLVTMALDLGGAETHVIELAYELQRRGHQVTVVSHGGRYVSLLEQQNISHVSIPLHKNDPISMGISYVKLSQLIEKSKPELIHTHARIPAFLCSLLKKKYHFPLVSTVHRVFDSQGIKGKLTRWGDWCVAVSPDIQEDLIRTYHYPKEKISLTVNGVDTNRFAPIAAQTSHTIVHVSRLDEDSWHTAHALLKAMPMVCASIPQTKLLIVGDGQYASFLQEEAQQINKQLSFDAVEMLGPQLDIPPILTQANLFVGVSRAALEAMACEIPCLLCGSEGYEGLWNAAYQSRYMASNYCCRNGTVVTSELLCRDILSFFSLSQNVQKKIGQEERIEVLAHYSITAMANAYEDAYAKVLKQRKHYLICGYYGFGNVGDECILTAILQNIHETNPLSQCTVLSATPQETKKQHHVDAVYRYDLFSLLTSLRKSDVFLFGGGGLLQDETSTRSLLYYLSLLRLAQWYHLPVDFYANGVGPFTKEESKSRAFRVLKDIPLLSVRDQDSYHWLQDIGIQDKQIIKTEDPFFSLAPVSVAFPKTPYLALSLRKVNSKVFQEEIVKFCQKIHEIYQWDIRLIPLQLSEDLAFHQKIQQKLGSYCSCISKTMNTEECLTEFGKASAIVSMRYHGICAGLLQKRPTYCIEANEKVSSLAKENGILCLGTPEEFSSSVLDTFELNNRQLKTIIQ